MLWYKKHIKEKQNKNYKNYEDTAIKLRMTVLIPLFKLIQDFQGKHFLGDSDLEEVITNNFISKTTSYAFYKNKFY